MNNICMLKKCIIEGNTSRYASHVTAMDAQYYYR